MLFSEWTLENIQVSLNCISKLNKPNCLILYKSKAQYSFRQFTFSSEHSKESQARNTKMDFTLVIKCQKNRLIEHLKCNSANLAYTFGQF